MNAFLRLVYVVARLFHFRQPVFALLTFPFAFQLGLVCHRFNQSGQGGVAACITNCTAAATLRHIRHTHTHTHNPRTPAQQVSLCSLCSCGLFWNISICMPASDTPPISPLHSRHASSQLHYALFVIFIGATSTQLVRIWFTRPSTWFMYSQIF